MDNDGDWAPREVTPATAGVGASASGLLSYLRDSPDLGILLAREKAMVFRGFSVSAETLESVMELLLPGRLAYVHGNSPRTKVGQNIYTSTEYPPQLTI